MNSDKPDHQIKAAELVEDPWAEPEHGEKNLLNAGDGGIYQSTSPRIETTGRPEPESPRGFEGFSLVDHTGVQIAGDSKSIEKLG